MNTKQASLFESGRSAVISPDGLYRYTLTLGRPKLAGPLRGGLEGKGGRKG